MTVTHMEVWIAHHETCYLQVRDGEVWACWVGQRGNQFRNLEAARKWLACHGYREMPC